MSDIRTLVKQSSQYALGRVANLLVGFVSFPVFARLLSVADYGVLNLVQRTCPFGVAVAKLGLQNAILRFHPQASSSDEDLRRLYSTTLFGSALGALSIAMASAVGLLLVPSGVMGPVVRIALLISCVLIVVRSVISPIYGFLRVEGRTLAFTSLDTATRVLTLVIGVAFVLWRGRSASSLLWGLVVAESLILLYSVLFLIRRDLISITSFDMPLLRSALVFTLPIAGSELAMTLLGGGDRILIQYFLGSQPLGYYAAAASMAGYMQDMLQTPLNLAMVPLYVSIWERDGQAATSRFLSESFDWFLLAAFGVSGTVFACSRELIVLVSSSKYAPAYSYLGPLVLANMFYASTVFLTAGFIVHKQTMKMARLVTIVFVAKCVLNVFLLPRIGLWGAVLPSLFGSSLLAVLYGWYSHKLLPLHVSLKRCTVYTAAALAAALAGRLVSPAGLLFSFLGKSTLALLVFGAMVYLLDARVRRALEQALHLLKRSDANPE